MQLTWRILIAFALGAPSLLHSRGVFAQQSASPALNSSSQFGSKPAIPALAIVPDGKGFVYGSQTGVFFRTWDGRQEQPIATQLENVHQLSFSPDGSILAVAGGSPAEFGSVELWSWPARKMVSQLDGHDDLVYDVVWLTDRKGIATASADRTVRVWDAASGKAIATLAGHSGPVLCLAFSPDQKLLCSGSADQTIRVWDTNDWRLLRSMNNHLGPVHSLVFRLPPDGPDRVSLPLYLASAGGDNTVRIWQPDIGRMVRIVRHPAPVFCLAWDSGGTLVSGSKDGHVRTIDAETGDLNGDKLLGSGWITSLALTPGGGQVVTGNSLGEIRLSPR